MMATFRRFVLPVYLFFCLVLGGSSQSVWGVLALRIVAIAMIAWLVVERHQRDGKRALLPIALLICGLLVVAAQLVPLPVALWTRLPGRELLIQGFTVLGGPLPWQPISLTPVLSLQSMLFLLPPIAVFLWATRRDESGIAAAVVALLLGALANVFLGYLQLATRASATSGWYLYEQTNSGTAVGFFANHNHMGLLLVVVLPFLAAAAVRFVRSSARAPVAVVVLAAVLGVALLLGIAMNGSMAALVLSVPVIAATTTLLPRFSRFRAVALAAAGVSLLAATVFLTTSPVQPKLTGENLSSIETRQEIWGTTWSLIEGSFPVGTGFGSFEKVYATAEPLDGVTTTYVNHAHNDYLELLLEGGLPVAILVIAFLGWWAARAVRIFSSPLRDGFRRAAVIASGAILAHSVVDYPLRTTAIAATFAFCAALLVPRSDSGDVGAPGGARHVSIG